MKNALVCGAGGFIGHHMVRRLKSEGYYVVGADQKYPEFCDDETDQFYLADLRDPFVCRTICERTHFDEMYQFAADMGGAGFVFTGLHDAAIMHNSALINLNMARQAAEKQIGKVFFSSSACVCPAFNQVDPDNPKCDEASAYPASPDSEYGWEKLFSERLWLASARNQKLNIRIARYHNIFGPEGTWEGGREKAPAALCRKIALARAEDEIEIWGDGKQTRSFLYIDECIEATRRLMQSYHTEPVNIGSEEMVSINLLAGMIGDIAGIPFGIKHIPGPLGVRGRNSDNTILRKVLGWEPTMPLADGLEKTYAWIHKQIYERKD